MLDFITAMFLTPEAQTDAHYWASVLLAHVLLGGVLASVLAAFTHDFPLGVVMSVSCWAAWEGAQVILWGGQIADGIIDLLANICGAVIVAALWYRRARLAALVAAIPAALIALRLRGKR